MTEARRHFPKLLLVMLALFMSLIVLEIVLRVFKLEQAYSPDLFPYNFPCYEPKSYYWGGLKPNSECIFHSNADAFADFKVETNSMGLRDKEIVNPKPADTKRILFIGDSLTMGIGVREEDTFVSKVESLLNESTISAKFETINAGVPGTGVSYHYLFLKNEGLKLKPDIVVIGFYPYNDLNGVKDAIWEDIDTNGLPTKAGHKTHFIGVGGNLRDSSTPIKFRVPYLRSSYVFALFSDFLFPIKNSQGPPSKIPEHFCIYKRACRDLDDAKEKTKKLFLGIKKITDANNQKLLIAFMPAEFQIDDNAQNKYQVALLPNDKNYPYEYFGDFFEKNDIEYLDMRPYFPIKTLGYYFFVFDDHLNSRGHAVVAQTISEKLIDYFK